MEVVKITRKSYKCLNVTDKPFTKFGKFREIRERLDKVKQGREAHPDVIKHWESIVAGNVPFGYKIKED